MSLGTEVGVLSGRDCLDILGALTHFLNSRLRTAGFPEVIRTALGQGLEPASTHSRRRGGSPASALEASHDRISIASGNSQDPGGTPLDAWQPKAPALGLGITLSRSPPSSPRPGRASARLAGRGIPSVTSLTSRVLEDPSGCLPARPSVSPGRTGTPVPSMPRTIVEPRAVPARPGGTRPESRSQTHGKLRERRSNSPARPPSTMAPPRGLPLQSQFPVANGHLAYEADRPGKTTRVPVESRPIVKPATVDPGQCSDRNLSGQVDARFRRVDARPRSTSSIQLYRHL